MEGETKLLRDDFGETIYKYLGYGDKPSKLILVFEFMIYFVVFASQTLTPARPGYPEGTKPSSCGPMPVGGDLNPLLFTSVK